METKVNAGASTSVLTDKVVAIKKIARDSLRMKLISPRLSKIASLEADITATQKEIADTEHDIVVEKYENSVLDQNHPDYTKHKTSGEETIKSLTEANVESNKAIDQMNKDIAEQKDGIAKIESGETKVSKEELDELVASLIKTESREEVKVEVA